MTNPIEFTGCRPVFEVADLRASVAFYVDKLAFKLDWDLDHEIYAGHKNGRPTFCLVICSYFELFLREVDEPERSVVVVGCPSRAAVDNAYEEYTRRGLEVDPPEVAPWGTYGIDVHDPDDNMLSILH